MTARIMFDEMVAVGSTTIENIGIFFALLAQDTLENQEAMTLTPNDFGTEYTTVTGAIIKVVE